MPRVGSTDLNSNESVKAMSKAQKSWRQLVRLSRGGNQSWGAVDQSSPIVLLRYLFKWQASIYRLIWLDVLVWLVLYYIVALIYRLALNDQQKTTMEDLIRMTARWAGDVPVTFLLGFFVSTVVSRWWSTYSSIPRLGGASAAIRTYFRNMADQQEAEQLRKEIGRYLNLAWILCLRQYSGILLERQKLVESIVSAVNELKNEGIDVDQYIKHFKLYVQRKPNDLLQQQLNSVTQRKQQQQQPASPEEAASRVGQQLALINEDPVVKATLGDLITSSELQVFMQLARQQWSRDHSQYRPQWWIPLYWANAIAERAAFTKNVPGTDVYAKLVETIFGFGGQLTELSNYATRKLPNVYLQVVIVAVYTTYFAYVITKQFIDPTRATARKISGYWIDYYFPIFALLQLVFLIGWFKVALVVLDPFGTDDEDFPLGSIFSSNLQSAVAMCRNTESLYPPKLQLTLMPLQQMEAQVGAKSKLSKKGLRNPGLCLDSDLDSDWSGIPDTPSSSGDEGEEGDEDEAKRKGPSMESGGDSSSSDVTSIVSDR